MYFWCFGFRGELGFLNCDYVCMCVVNKQFDLNSKYSQCRYAHFHQVARQLRDSRMVMFCARYKIDLGSFGRCHACAVCLIKSYIYSASVLWKLCCQILFFSTIFADFERRIGASEFFEHQKNGGNTHSTK